MPKVGLLSMILWDISKYSIHKSKMEYPSLKKYPRTKSLFDGFVWLLRYTLAIKLLLLGLSIAGFSGMFTWWFTLVLILGIIIHEFGHIYALEMFEIKHSGMFLIPFIGGVVYAEEYKTKWQSALVALAGPAFGLGMTAICFVASVYINTKELWICTSWLAFLNLLNLLPVYPLDGRAVIQEAITSISSAASYIFMGAFLLVGLMYALVSGSFILTFVAGLTIYDVLLARVPNNLTNMSTLQTVVILLLYASITGALLMFFLIGLNISRDLTSTILLK